MSQQNSYKGFKDLNCWKEARLLRISISELTRTFPDNEKYQLTSQMNRAARSVTANMAEGYGRYTFIDTKRFFIHSRGSVTELLDHISVAMDEGYIDTGKAEELEKHCESIFRLINGYIGYLEKSAGGTENNLSSNT